MPDGRLSGGGNQLLLYPIDSAHTTVGALEITLESNIKPDVTDTQVTLDQCKADQDLWDFANTYASSVAESAAATEAETVTLDDGTGLTASGGTAGSSSQNFLGVLVGATSGSNVQCTAFLCTVNPATGGFSQEYRKFQRPNVTLDLVDAVAAVALTTTELGAKYGAAATLTIPIGKAKQVSLLAAP